MKVAKISEIQHLADGSAIGEMTLKIDRVFAPKTGQGKHGPWRLTSAVVSDETGESNATFWGDKDIQALTGKRITLKSKATDRGLNGITVKYYKEGKINQLSFSPLTIIEASEGAVADYVKKSAPSTPHKAMATDIVTAKKRIYQSAQLYQACMVQARNIAVNEDLSNEHFQAMCASLYISADRAGLFACFPDGPEAQTQLELSDDIPF